MRADFQSALLQQDLVWNSAWGGLTEDIVGIEVLPFTPLHFVRLAAARSPFVCGGRTPNEADCGNFLWAVSPFFAPASRWNKFRHWTAYYRATRKLSIGQLVAAIDEYLDEAWQDSPAKAAGKSKHQFACPVTSFMFALCHPYNLTPAEVMITSYKCLFQLFNQLTEAAGNTVLTKTDLMLLRERAQRRQQRPKI